MLHTHILLLYLMAFPVVLLSVCYLPHFFLWTQQVSRWQAYTEFFCCPWPFELGDVFFQGMSPPLYLLSVLPSPGFEGCDYVLGATLRSELVLIIHDSFGGCIGFCPSSSSSGWYEEGHFGSCHDLCLTGGLGAFPHNVFRWST